jgi:cobalamin-dependent methionine synthase I
VLLAATPAGQRHELGALMAATAAAAEGWRIVYLGPDLPAGDVVTAARRTGASLIALSVVFPAVDAELLRDISAVRSALPAIPLVVGGRAALAAAEDLRAAGAVVAGDLNALRLHLRRHVI